MVVGVDCHGPRSRLRRRRAVERLGDARARRRSHRCVGRPLPHRDHAFRRAQSIPGIRIQRTGRVDHDRVLRTARTASRRAGVGHPLPNRLGLSRRRELAMDTAVHDRDARRRPSHRRGERSRRLGSGGPEHLVLPYVHERMGRHRLQLPHRPERRDLRGPRGRTRRDRRAFLLPQQQHHRHRAPRHVHQRRADSCRVAGTRAPARRNLRREPHRSERDPASSVVGSPASDDPRPPRRQCSRRDVHDHGVSGRRPLFDVAGDPLRRRGGARRAARPPPRRQAMYTACTAAMCAAPALRCSIASSSVASCD